MRHMNAPANNPLITEAMKKAVIAWLGVSELTPYPVWCLWIDDSLYVVSGPGEQPAPGLAHASTVAVTARGDHGGRIVTWRARAERVRPETDAWAAAVPQLAAKRLNSTGADVLARRWATDCVVSRLVPTGDAPEGLPDGSLATTPAATPATRATSKPFRLHRVRRHRP
jgi:hypothetical protein